MRYKDIKEFSQRCEEHPDHQNGMISHQMLLDRAHEEIDELRKYIEQRTWVGLTESDVSDVCANNHPLDGVFTFARAIEAKLKEKNTRQDGDCKHCVNGCPACDARRQLNVLP